MKTGEIISGSYGRETQIQVNREAIPSRRGDGKRHGQVARAGWCPDPAAGPPVPKGSGVCTEMGSRALSGNYPKESTGSRKDAVCVSSHGCWANYPELGPRSFSVLAEAVRRDCADVAELTVAELTAAW